eukprot:2538198-Lingulodinium_polyedra.AAC.1
MLRSSTSTRRGSADASSWPPPPALEAPGTNARSAPRRPALGGNAPPGRQPPACLRRRDGPSAGLRSGETHQTRRRATE